MAYDGLCIGGPRDGQWIASETRTWEAVSLQMMSAYAPWSDAPDKPIALDRVTYTFFRLGRQGVFVADSIEGDMDVVIATLLAGYRRPHTPEPPA